MHIKRVRNVVGLLRHRSLISKIRSSGTYRDLDINMGQKIGWFNLGSTIVMVFDAPQFVFRVARGQKVKLGETLGNILTPDLKNEIELENQVRVAVATRKQERAVQEIKDVIGFEKTAARVRYVGDELREAAAAAHSKK